MRLKSVAGVLLVGALLVGIVSDPVGMSRMFDAVLCQLQYAGDQIVRFLQNISSSR